MDSLVADVLGDVALIMVLSAVFGAGARRCGQPAVVGQILAGIVLGPTLLGRLPWHLTSRLFSPRAIPYLNVLAQFAVVIFMFLVGYELDRRSLHGRLPLLVAGSAVLIPMCLGAGSAFALRSQFAAAGQSHISRSFVLFIAVAMSVTALPVLATIVRERGMAGTFAGMTAISAAGVMDVSAWLVLAAALIGTADKPNRPWPSIVILFAAFVAIMLTAVRPVLHWFLSRPLTVLANPLPVALALALASAWITTSLGLHPVIGGFLAGLTMPRFGDSKTPDADLLRPMEQIGGLFLPLFFVVVGLSTDIGAMNGPALVVLLILSLIASVGKIGPAFAAARIGGLDARESGIIAVLVNTRGLTELIALNVGLNAGIIGPRLFSILVLMALIMTIATAPLQD